MEKIKAFIKGHTTWIIIILFLLFAFKSCQSCSRKNTASFNEIRYEAVCDSLKSEIVRRDSTINELVKHRDVAIAERDAARRNNDDLREANSGMSKRENELVKTIYNQSKEK